MTHSIRLVAIKIILYIYGKESPMAPLSLFGDYASSTYTRYTLNKS